MYIFENKLAVGTQHCHTENSLDDSTLSTEKLCARIKELGGTTAFISDHGTCMGWDDFTASCKKYELKPVYGVESYLYDGESYRHLVLYAKDMEGYHQICLAMSRGVPRGDNTMALTDDCLDFFKGGHVVATSACIGGVLCLPYLLSLRAEEKATALRSNLSTYNFSEEEFVKKEEEIERINAKISELREQLSETKKLAGKKLTKEENRLAKLKTACEKSEDEGKWLKGLKKILGATPNSVDEAYSELDYQISKLEVEIMTKREEIKKANEEVVSIASGIENEKNCLVSLKADFQVLKTNKEKYLKAEEKIKAIEGKILSQKEIDENAYQMLNRMREVFGNDFYIEIQNHGMQFENILYPWVAKIAHANNVPLIAANDVHMAENTEKDKFAREIRKSCRFKKWDSLDKGEDQLYIKTDKELFDALCEIVPADDAESAIKNVWKIAEECNVVIKKEKHAPKAKFDDFVSATWKIKELALANKSKYPDWGEKHQQRFDYELGVIDRMGFSDYFYIVWDILNVSRKVGGLSYDDLAILKGEIASGEICTTKALLDYIEQRPVEPNISVGLGRGSGAGSLVCYLLGITNIDPFKYGLMFERFLNPERVSMPDIDSDLRTDIKDVVVAYLKMQYGDRAIAQILTKSYLQGKSAIDKVVMILGDRDNTDYRYIADKLKKKNGVDFSKSISANKDALLQGCSSDIERKIVEASEIMDGNIDHVGLHAAGCIISDNDDLAKTIPVAWDEKAGTWKTQCDMVQCESLHGLLKMDLLLLKTLDIITNTLRILKVTQPDVSIDIENLEIEEKVIAAIYAKGDTNSIFQFESGGMVKNLRALEPTSIEDVIAMNAMYRPGPIDEIPNYISNKRSGKIEYLCPQLEPILKETRGIIVYQEQVMEIFRSLAGFSVGHADKVRRAMSKKHLDELVAERESFLHGDPKEPNLRGCVANGISEDVANQIFDKMLSFASYAFNKAHAAAYSVTSYMTAYLKYYYPAEFFAAVLNNIGAIDELPPIVADAKAHGVKILPPDVNKSQANFTVENGNIRFGLSFLRGVKGAAQTWKHGEIKTVKDLVDNGVGKAFAEALIFSGAMDCTNILRKDMMNEFYGLTKSKELVPEMNRIDYLVREYNYTSIYFSGNPLDSFYQNKNKGISGLLSDVRPLLTKKNKEKMLAGTIVTSEGVSYPFVIFPETYRKYESELEICGAFSRSDSKAVLAFSFNGNFKQDGEGQQLIVSEVEKLKKNEHAGLLVHASNASKLKTLVDSGELIATEKGIEVFLIGNDWKKIEYGTYNKNDLVKYNVPFFEL